MVAFATCHDDEVSAAAQWDLVPAGNLLMILQLPAMHVLNPKRAAARRAIQRLVLGDRQITWSKAVTYLGPEDRSPPHLDTNRKILRLQGQQNPDYCGTKNPRRRCPSSKTAEPTTFTDRTVLRSLEELVAQAPCPIQPPSSHHQTLDVQLGMGRLGKRRKPACELHQ
ncbi:hypothetical protein HPB52_006222 [Rhipicephalus sanguineus]|uniref:Uncharacterized protein n=1 Tax=Rhipicephalus sanguineus TaxID=34632 RepID=A0A9D4PL26_RHISA|nr:hypothetical protein HPB52_006222 [Rhipicephalus sanguineus]